MPTRLLLVAGARPNFMKVAPLIRAIERRNVQTRNGQKDPDYRLVHTGQHYDAQMSDIFFEELQIPRPNVCLEVGSGSHAVQTARVMERFEPVCLEYRPNWVVVVGDVNSTMACALVASKLGIKVAHVEAGLRSGDRTMPEEINRIVTDAISDLLLTPSADADENLKREGIPDSKIRLVGNVMIDALVANLDGARQSGILGRLGLKEKEFAYVTLHRPSNVDDCSTLDAIVKELRRLAEIIPVVFPVHPRTRRMLSEFGISCDGIEQLRMIDPIGCHDSVCLTEKARLVLTDSGGLQEESTFFRTPCLTLRPNTERPVTVSSGSNRLTSLQRLRADLVATINGPRHIGELPPWWDGEAGGRIIDALCQNLG
jgi:UDP-N-acetylglucosamine 2-epimerase (non-hydrolysing)